MPKKIVYVHTGLSSFVRKDIEILKSEFSVEVFHFKLFPKWKIPFRILKFFILGIKKRKETIYVIQFAGFHSLPAALSTLFFKSPTILVLGGTDCVKFESIDYGNFTRKALGWSTEFCLKHASLLLPVDQSLVLYDYIYQNKDSKQQGYKAHCKSEINTPYKVIYNGYDADKWKCNYPLIKKRTSFVTVVSNVKTRFAIQLKGLDLILEIAAFFKEYDFYIVGGTGLNTTLKVSENVTLLDNIPNENLNQFLIDKKYYLQLSISEGFPNALCEAILSGCIPIVSSVGAMPMIVNNNKFVLQEKSVDRLILLIQEIEETNSETLEKDQLVFRNRIINEFNLKRRKEELTQIVRKFMN